MNNENNEEMNQGSTSLKRTEPVANDQINGSSISTEEINNSILSSAPGVESVNAPINTIDPMVNVNKEVSSTPITEDILPPNLETRNTYSEPPVSITQEQPSILDSAVNAPMDSNTVTPSINTSDPKPIYSSEAPKEKSKKGILIGIIVLLVLAIVGGFVYLKFFGNISHKVYKLAVEKGIGNIFDSVRADDAYQYDISFNVNLDVSDEIVPNDVKDLINNLKLNLTTQIDKVNHKAFIKLDTMHQNESILKADVLAELNTNIAYVHLPDFLDKYIIAENNDFSELTKALDKKYDYKAIEKVLKREVVKLIKEEECTNEDGYYIWKVNSKDLANRTAAMINILKSDSEFVNAMGGKDEVEAMFGTGFITADDITKSFDIIIKLNDKSYDITFDTYNISGDVNDDTLTYNIKQQGTSLMSGSITTKGSIDDRTVNVMVTVPQVGTIKVNVASKYSKLVNIDDIDKANAIKSDEISEEDRLLMQQKLQTSALYALISPFISEDTSYDNSSYSMQPVNI